MFELLIMIVCAAFFYKVGQESRISGVSWCIISIICFLGGSFLLPLFGGVISQIVLFFGITLGRVLMDKPRSNG